MDSTQIINLITQWDGRAEDGFQCWKKWNFTSKLQAVLIATLDEHA